MSNNLLTTNRNMKDRVFRMLFSEKKDLLSLYNALNGTDYTEPDDIEITTLSDAIFMGMKNDCSFIIGDYMNLYEHQSTWSPNFALRFLYYISDLYKMKFHDDKLYSRKLVKLPSPVCIVFYNGERKLEDDSIQCLSDAFSGQKNFSEMELKVRVMNINIGHNKDLMEKCQLLRDYSLFIGKIKTYNKLMSINDAVIHVMNECISEGILSEFLKSKRGLVMDSMLYEYDQKKVEEMWAREAVEIGAKIGAEMADEARVTDIVNLMDSMKLTWEEALDALKIPEDKKAHYYDLYKKIIN